MTDIFNSIWIIANTKNIINSADELSLLVAADAKTNAIIKNRRKAMANNPIVTKNRERTLSTIHNKKKNKQNKKKTQTTKTQTPQNKDSVYEFVMHLV